LFAARRRSRDQSTLLDVDEKLAPALCGTPRVIDAEAIVATRTGKKELVGFQTGVRESGSAATASAARGAKQPGYCRCTSPNGAALAVRQNAEAVMFDFVKTAGSGRWLVRHTRLARTALGLVGAQPTP
jgi:hypothetical protein